MYYKHEGKRWIVEYVAYGPGAYEIWLEDDDDMRAFHTLPPQVQEELMEMVQAEEAVQEQGGWGDYFDDD